MEFYFYWFLQYARMRYVISDIIANICCKYVVFLKHFPDYNKADVYWIYIVIITKMKTDLIVLFTIIIFCFL